MENYIDQMDPFHAVETLEKENYLVEYFKNDIYYI